MVSKKKLRHYEKAFDHMGDAIEEIKKAGDDDLYHKMLEIYSELSNKMD